MGALTINTNLSSLNTQRVLELNRSQLGKSINTLSSGVKVAGSSAELVLSEGIRSDVQALQQGSRNLNDGLALLRTGEGALNEVSSILIRLRSLASQSANGTVGQDERQTVDLEYQNLLNELDRISNTTEFRGTKLLDGSLANSAEEHLIIQLGIDSSAANQIDLNSKVDLTEISREALNLGTSNVRSEGSAFLALNDLTSAIDAMIEIRSKAGTTEIRLSHALNNLNSQIENLTAAVSTIRDADIAEELATLTKNQILVQAGVAMLGQANLIPQAVLTLFEGVQ
ncbi:MAG: flagellin FliC [Nitrospinaceae bacterium]|jgi:flagellin|nr:flagellin FliC [Nitrospina sp.]MBT5869879.1 flagellin FliC [Nitrospinaceae bacterium]